MSRKLLDVMKHTILDIINRIQSYMDRKLFSCEVFIDLRDQSEFKLEGGGGGWRRKWGVPKFFTGVGGGS